MTVKKKTKKMARGRKTRRDDGLVQILRAELKLDLSPSGARGLRSSLESALRTTDGTWGWSAQVRIDASDLNSIYLYMGKAQMEKIVERLSIVERLAEGAH